ncbi:hypothetical protein Tco_0295067 [Tanacetum coccineum]
MKTPIGKGFDCCIAKATSDESIMAQKMRVYVSQPPGFVDPDHPKKVYKVVKLCMDCIKLLELDIKKFDLVIVKTAINPWRDQSGRLQKDKEAVDVDVHLYRSMIGTDKSDIHINKQSKRASTDTESEESKRCQRIKAKPESQASVNHGSTKRFAENSDFLTRFPPQKMLYLLILLSMNSPSQTVLGRLLLPTLTNSCDGTLDYKQLLNIHRGFRGAPRPLLPVMLLVATTNPDAGQEHPYVAQSQPSSSTIPVPSTSLPPVQSPSTIPTPIPAYTPTPIPETDPEPMEHTFEEPSPAHQHFSPLQEHAQGQRTLDYLFQVVPQLMTKIDSLEKDLKQTKLTMGSAM